MDAGQLGQDQHALLDKQRRLKDGLAEINSLLNDNANEYLLKAKLTAIDYSLPDRIGQTSGFYESALQSARTLENIFEYAKFLQDNNQFQSAEVLYLEALELCQKLAINDPAAYEPKLAKTLNNLGIIYGKCNLRMEAEDIYRKSLELYQKLAEFDPITYKSNVALVLNNLATVVKIDKKRQAEAETLYREALAICRQLDKTNPNDYESKIAGMLCNLAELIGDDNNRQIETES